MAIIAEQSIRWGLLCRQAIFWVFVELMLNVIGLDNLVDCIEYLLTRQKQAAIVQSIYLDGSIQNNYCLEPGQIISA